MTILSTPTGREAIEECQRFMPLVRHADAADWLMDAFRILRLPVQEGSSDWDAWEKTVFLLGVVAERQGWPIVKGR